MIAELTTNLKFELEKAKNPVLSWSGGKDSTFLLNFIYELGFDIPVISFHHLWNRYQKIFIKSVVKKRKFPIFFYAPIMINFADNLVETFYNIGGHYIPIYSDHIYDKRYCGLDIVNNALNEKHIQPNYPWDLTIIGTKGTDRHPMAINGIDFLKLNNDNHRFLMPLKDFTDEQVLFYCKKYNYEIDKRVYEQKDIKADTGCFIACMNCINKTGEVFCPKVKSKIMTRGI